MKPTYINVLWKISLTNKWNQCNNHFLDNYQINNSETGSIKKPMKTYYSKEVFVWKQTKNRETLWHLPGFNMKKSIQC